MVEYAKPWLSLEGQVDRLASHGVDVGDRGRAATFLGTVGCYRLTGNLYPFRESEEYTDEGGRTRIHVLSDYRPGTALAHAEAIIGFDRTLRILVMEALERIEVAVRMRVGHVLGRISAFAHDDPACFTEAFTEGRTDPATGETSPSQHDVWLQRVAERQAGSDEQFVSHFREKYDDRMPVWALTEILELGQLARAYRGLRQEQAEEVALAFGVPTKKIMSSWLASMNYVRNVSAHHARLFNRKLQYSPARPSAGMVPLLDHLRIDNTAKGVFGTYNALAVIAYLLPTVEPSREWHRRMVG